MSWDTGPVDGEPGPVDEDDAVEDVRADVPDWEDEYLDRVADRMAMNFDLEKDYRVRGERFELYGRFELERQKELVISALNYANHEAVEHVFARRIDRVSTADLDRLVDLGHDLADEWIEADEEHFGTEFTFVVVASDLPDAVRSYVDGFRDRTLLKYGYYGSYEVNLAVIAPDREEYVASQEADVARAFALWEDPGTRRQPTGLLARLKAAIWR